MLLTKNNSRPAASPQEAQISLPVWGSQRGFAVRFLAPLCKFRTPPTGSGSWLPCARGAGFLLRRSKKTEGLYPPTGESVYTAFPCAPVQAPQPPNESELGSPVYLKQECLRRLAAKTFCDWCFAPTAGGFTALATINDGALLLIEGELSKP